MTGRSDAPHQRIPRLVRRLERARADGELARTLDVLGAAVPPAIARVYRDPPAPSARSTGVRADLVAGAIHRFRRVIRPPERWFDAPGLGLEVAVRVRKWGVGHRDLDAGVVQREAESDAIATLAEALAGAARVAEALGPDGHRGRRGPSGRGLESEWLVADLVDALDGWRTEPAGLADDFLRGVDLFARDPTGVRHGLQVRLEADPARHDARARRPVPIVSPVTLARAAGAEDVAGAAANWHRRILDALAARLEHPAGPIAALDPAARASMDALLRSVPAMTPSRNLR